MTQQRFNYDPGPLALMILPELGDMKTRFVCTACRRPKLRRHFGYNKARPDRRPLQCRKCKRDASRAARAKLKREIAKLRKLQNSGIARP